MEAVEDEGKSVDSVHADGGGTGTTMAKSGRMKSKASKV